VTCAPRMLSIAIGALQTLIGPQQVANPGGRVSTVSYKYAPSDEPYSENQAGQLPLHIAAGTRRVFIESGGQFRVMEALDQPGPDMTTVLITGKDRSLPFPPPLSLPFPNLVQTGRGSLLQPSYELDAEPPLPSSLQPLPHPFIPRAYRGRDVMCPVSTGGGTRCVQLVREGGGGGQLRPRHSRHRPRQVLWRAALQRRPRLARARALVRSPGQPRHDAAARGLPVVLLWRP